MKTIKTMNKTRFSVIGSGYYIKIFNKDHELYQAITNLNHHDPAEFLLDTTLFQSLKLRDKFGEYYNNFYEVRPSNIFPVFCTDQYTRLEIRRDGSRRTSKIFFKDLIRTDYLFQPEYIKKDTVLFNDGLMALEYDKGHFGVTTHPREFENINQITFELITIPEINEVCIKSIKVADHEVILKQPDTLSYGFQAFLDHL